MDLFFVYQQTIDCADEPIIQLYTFIVSTNSLESRNDC